METNVPQHTPSNSDQPSDKGTRVGKQKTKKKIKAPLRIPSKFNIGDDLWEVQYRWRLTDSNGEKSDGFIVPAEKKIMMDKLILSEEKVPVFMKLLMQAIISKTILLNSASDIVSEDLAKFLLGNLKLRWKHGNEL